MTREAVVKVVQRAISDGAFRTQLTRDAGTALRGFDLTPSEIAAIKSGDSGRISSLGVDLRMSKAFTLAASDGRAEGVLTMGTDQSLAAGVNSTNSTLTSGDAGLAASVNSGTNSSLTTGDTAMASSVNSGNSVLTSDGGASVNATDTIDGGTGGGAVIPGGTTGESAGHQVVQWDGNDDAPLSTVIANEPAHSFGAQTPEGGAFGTNVLSAGDEYLTSVNYAATSGDGDQASSASGFATDEGQLTNALNTGVGEGGAGATADPSSEPNITP